MFFDAKLAPHVAEFRGDFTLHYGDEAFRVKRSDDLNKIEISEYDNQSCSLMPPRDRSEEELLQVLRDAEELAAKWSLNSWGGLGKFFDESLRERTTKAAAERLRLREAQVARRLPRGARRLVQR